MKKTATHIYFWKDKLGQWTMRDFEEDGVTYCCAEQYMMARKAKLFKDDETLKLIMETKSPAKHQKLGRIVKNYDQKVWDDNKELIVIDASRLKYSQNEEMKNALLTTGDRILVEASPYDKIWGVGLGEKDPLILDQNNWKGQNLLGKCLMIVRDELR